MAVPARILLLPDRMNSGGGLPGHRTDEMSKETRKAGNARGAGKSALAGAFMRHREGLRRFITRLVIKPEDVEDILQDTFVNAFSVKELGEVKSPKFYLYAVARRTAYRELKRQSGRMAQSIEEAIEKGDEPPSDEVRLEEALYSRAHFAVLSDVVAEFPAQCRRVFILRKVLGYSHKEISDAMGISISTVEKHLARAMLRCSQDHRLRVFTNSEISEGADDGAAKTAQE